MRFFCFSLILFFSLISKAQERDAGLWMYIAAEKKITSRFSVSLEEQLRLQENITQVRSIFTDVTAAVRMFRNFQTSFGYRFILPRQLDGSYRNRHRFYADLSYRYNFGDLRMANRVRVQTQYTDINRREQGNIPTKYVREKLIFRYPVFRRVSANVSGEIFIPLVNEKLQLLDQYRLTGAVNYSFNRRSELEVFYIYQQEVNVNNPVTDYITGIGYKHLF